MELLNKRELKKVCRDLGVSGKEFKRAHKEVYSDQNPTNGMGKYAAVGTLAGVSMIPSLMLADSPPAEVEKAKEEKNESLFKLGDNRADFSLVKGKPYVHGQNDLNLYVGKGKKKIARINDWLDGGLIGGKKGKEKVTKLYNELKIYFAPGLPIQPVVGADLEKGQKAIYRGGIATKMMEVIKGLKAGIEYYPFSNNEEDLVWIKTGIDLGKGWNLFGMTRRLYDKSDGKEAKKLKKVYRFRVSKDIGNGFQIAFNYWSLPKNKKGKYMIGLAKRY
ncbi:MAG: hypothetical protein V3U72_04145 [Candidatus Aenigmarchaeota archaeon]